ncbi:ABC transporter ATP-binding protein [Micrococcaceae bacterium Sec5.7]
MRHYPYRSPNGPNLRSPRHFLTWLGAQQAPTLAAGVAFGIVWMLAQAFSPLAIGKAIDEGIVGGDRDALWLWAGVLLCLAVVQAVTATLRHRMAVSNWLQAALRTNELVGIKVSTAGESLTNKLPTGEIVTAGSSDAPRIGQLFDVSARLSGSIVSYVAVSLLVARIYLPLGIGVLIGVPALGALLIFVVKPLQQRQSAQREATGRMTSVGADTVAGLRVLRGIGGERIFVDRYRQRSQEARIEGNRLAGSVATLEGSQLLIAGTFTVLFTWLGASLALNGQITAGQLISLYGFAAFLVSPIRTGSEALNVVIRAVVGSRKVISILETQPLVSDGLLDGPPAGSRLLDGLSGVEVPSGKLTALVSADPALSAGVAKRLGRFDDLASARVSWGGVPVADLPVDEVRRRISYSAAEPHLFTGPLRSGLDPHGRHSDARILEAIRTSSAMDVLDAIDGGLDHEVDEKGRSFSGGQRQRLALARALLTDAEILLLVEPSSAVDSHTEARIAVGLAELRGAGSGSGNATGNPGRTTLVVTASPLMLNVMDAVIYLPEKGSPVTGTHSELLATQPDYKSVVIRSE